MRWALVLGVCVAVVVGGCGGGSDNDSTSSSTSETTPTASAAQLSRQSSTPTPHEKGKQDKAKPGGSSAKSANSQKQGNGDSSHPKRVEVPPISSAPVAGSRPPAPGVKTVKGADNSVQEYGVESGESERREAAIALQAYLNARAEEDWGRVCGLLARKPTEQLQKLESSGAGKGTELKGCPAAMAFLDKGTPQSQLRAEATITEVLSFRGGGDISGDPSYLILTAPPAQTLYSMPMYFEGGAWKVGLALPSELPVN